MKFGFVGSGNMARSMAIALSEPALFADSGSGRAAELAALTSGATATPSKIAEQCDVVFLAHKPKQLREVAGEMQGFSGVIVSVLAATPLSELRSAHPAARVVRVMPNIPVEFGAGVIGIAAESDRVPALDTYLARFGTVADCPEDQFELFTAISGCAPAFFALFAESLVASAKSRGMDEALAAGVVNQTMSGTATVLAANGLDTADLKRRVASPGGLTEKALESFDRAGLADAVDGAVATVLGQ